MRSSFVAPPLFRLACYAILGFWLLVVLVPLYWVVITSFKMPITIRLGPSYLPWVDFPPVLDNWRALLVVRPGELGEAFLHSLIITLSSTALAVLCGSMAGYALARFQYRVLGLRNEGIAYAFLSQRMFPPFLLVLPFLILFRFIGLLDTQVALIITYTAFNLPLVVWITRDVFASLPAEMEDSALIDGCSRWQAFLRIALPLSGSGLVAAFAICFIFTWNEYFIGLMLSFREAQSLTVYLAGHGYGAALTLFCVLPPLLVGIVGERFITARLLGGAIR